MRARSRVALIVYGSFGVEAASGEALGSAVDFLVDFFDFEVGEPLALSVFSVVAASVFVLALSDFVASGFSPLVASLFCASDSLKAVVPDISLGGVLVPVAAAGEAVAAALGDVAGADGRA